MKLPLYKEAQGLLQQEFCPKGANTGLWYNKMCNKWAEHRGKEWSLNAVIGKGEKERTCKVAWLETVTKEPCGDPPQIQEALQRYITLIRARAGEVKVYSTVSRFVTGLGNDHPIENGFTWHHVLGTPFLPASSVKGMLRNWAEQWWEGPNRDNVVEELFGPRDGEKSVGRLIVFDALPVRPVQLEIEVMTPHYGPYYQGEQEADPPADWYSPNPISFLTVAAKQSFIFGLAPRQAAKIDMDLVFSWLDEALGLIGAGAKTASGYGCFQPDRVFRIPEVRKPQPARREVKAALSPMRQEMEDDGFSNPNPQIFMHALTVKWLDKMDSENIPAAERLEIAEKLAEWYRTNMAKEWEKPKKKSKNYDKIGRIKEVLGINGV